MEYKNDDEDKYKPSKYQVSLLYIAEVVEFTHYQILGFSLWTVEIYIKEYFKDK